VERQSAFIVDPEYKYGLLRIKQISSGQAEFKVSENAYNKPFGVQKNIRENRPSLGSYYDAGSLYMDVNKLKSMNGDAAIYSIERI